MHLIHYLLIIVEVAAFALVPVILVQRKEPVSTFAWILTLIFLPVFGALLFLVFGRSRIHIAYPVGAALGDPPEPSPAALPADDPAAAGVLARDCFRIACALTHVGDTRGNQVTVLIDGDATYQALGEAIDQAQHHVHAEYYLIHDDQIGHWFRERLIAAARRGVRVKLLYDGYGSLGIGRRWTHPLREAGAQTATFSPLHRALLASPSLRNHRKIVVVDGGIGFTGGINISDHHSRQKSGAQAWRDIHLRLTGPAVAELQRIFLRDWAYVTAVPVPPAGLFPPIHPAEDGSRVSIVPSGPDTHTEAIHRVFFAAMTGARRRIRIMSPYFGPDDTILVAMELAAVRGVDVQMILPARSNHRVTFHAGRSLYERLLAAGVAIYEYQPGMIHAKALIIDDALALVGSSNMDLRSFRLNFEVHALIHDATTISTLHAAFAESLSASIAIDAVAWTRRGLRLQLIEGLARLLSPLL